jgi:hypothetical protein
MSAVEARNSAVTRDGLVTKDHAESVLAGANRWLEGAGASLSGAVPAKQAIASLLETFSSGSANTPQNEHELVKMIVWEGRLFYDPTAPLMRQSKQLADAVGAAIDAALNEEALRH